MAKLRQAEVELAKGQTIGLVCKRLGIGEQSCDLRRQGVPPAVTGERACATTGVFCARAS